MSISKLVKLKPDEKIIAVFRQYGGTYSFSVFIAFILLVLPFFLLTPLFSRGFFGVIGFCLLLAIAFYYSLRKAFKWYYNMCVLTDRRIIDVDQRGFLERVVSEVLFTKIQDVSYRVKGFFPTIFHYGTVIVQTAGNSTNVELRAMKNPERIADLINEFRENAKEPQQDEKMKKITELVSGLSEDDIHEFLKNKEKRSRDEATKDFFSSQ